MLLVLLLPKPAGVDAVPAHTHALSPPTRPLRLILMHLRRVCVLLLLLLLLLLLCLGMLVLAALLVPLVLVR